MNMSFYGQRQTFRFLILALQSIFYVFHDLHCLYKNRFAEMYTVCEELTTVENTVDISICIATYDRYHP